MRIAIPLVLTIAFATASCVLDDEYALELDEEALGSIESPLALWRSDQNGIIYPGNGYWGSWRDRIYCNEGMWAVGYKMRVEGSLGGGDDTALNSVKLYCKNPSSGATEWISSYDGNWGAWYPSATCPGSNNFLKGARMKIEPSQGGGDDTAANDVEFACIAGGTVHATGGAGWGSWGSWTACPNDAAVCGLEIRFEHSQGGGDDTAMNGLRLHCCDLGDVDPPQCTPTTCQTGQCGYVSDGCGGTIYCGQCPSPPPPGEECLDEPQPVQGDELRVPSCPYY